MFWLLIVLLFIVSQAKSQVPSYTDDAIHKLGLDALPSGHDTDDFLIAYDSILFNIILRCEIQNIELSKDDMYRVCFNVVFDVSLHDIEPLEMDIFDFIFNEINEQLIDFNSNNN